VLRVIGPSSFIPKIILASCSLLLVSDPVLLACHGSEPSFSVYVGGRLRCKVRFLEKTASSRPRRRALHCRMGMLSACIRADITVIRVLRCPTSCSLPQFLTSLLLVASTPVTIWAGKWQADRIVTRRLRHSDSFMVCNPRALQESSKGMGSSPRPGRCDVEITFPWRCVRLRRRSQLRWRSTGPLRRLREVAIASRMA
jgi:hypothetical protein